MLKLAILLPLYKNDKLELLKLSVDSIMEQKYNNFKIIILVDGPVSKSVILYLHSLNNKKTELLIFKQNRGLPSVLNEGIKFCLKEKYEYIARMDADDISHQERFSKQLEYLELNKDTFALGTEAFIINDSGEIVGEKKVSSEITFNVLKMVSDIIHPSIIFRSTFFEKVGFYDENLLQSQDYDLWFRAIIRQIKIESLKESLYFLRYDTRIVERRKKAQKYVLKIKIKYLKWYHYYCLLPQIFIISSPKFLLKNILFKKIRN